MAGDPKRGIQPAKAVYFETVTNPLLKVNDVHAIAEIAHRYGTIVIVDNTFVTPYLQNPLDLGADIVLHSATKYLAGHSDVIAGLVVVKDEQIGQRVYFAQNRLGGVLAPLNAIPCVRASKHWLFAWNDSRRMPPMWRNTCLPTRW